MMGTLVVMHYPTVLALGAADHTYVKCDTGGKAWSCWGGKTGGKELRRGTGSTRQADAIAEPNERARVRCYLVNGVCHQAANRILFPAGILVRGARGYGLSELIYGPYGRLAGPLRTCQAPFNRHAGVTGDLPECAAPGARPPTAMEAEATGTPDERRREQAYLDNVRNTYSKGETLARGRALPSSADKVEFAMELLMHKIEFNLGPDVNSALVAKLREIRASSEGARIEIEEAFSQRKMKPRDFVRESDHQIGLLQKHMAAVLRPGDFELFLNLKQGEVIALADPEIVRRVYADD